MNSRTPDPWEAMEDSFGNWYIAGGEDDIVCELTDTDRGQDIMNARLIAAAPKLLCALKGLLSLTVDPALTAPEQRDEVRAALQAIVAAEGEEQRKYPTLRWQHRYTDEDEWHEGGLPEIPRRPGTLEVRVHVEVDE